MARLVFVAVVALSLPFAVGAQSMTVLGGDTYARDCYMAATIAAQLNLSSPEDARTCTQALEHGKLSMRDRVATFVNRGVVYVALEEYLKAVRDYDSALALKPKSGEVYVNVGNLFYMSRIYDRAVKEYTRALDLGLTKDHVAHFNRGMAYEKLGDFSNAEADYRRAAELVPEWHQPLARLDRLQRRAAQPEVDSILP